MIAAVDVSPSLNEAIVALCRVIGDVLNTLEAEGVNLRFAIYGINNDVPAGCILPDNNFTMKGNMLTDFAVPFALFDDPCYPAPSGSSESWAWATGTLCEEFEWREGIGPRVIAPLFDEGPCLGFVFYLSAF